MLREIAARSGTLRLEHIATCCCRYVCDPATVNDVKLIDTRCIAAYLIPEVELEQDSVPESSTQSAA